MPPYAESQYRTAGSVVFRESVIPEGHEVANRPPPPERKAGDIRQFSGKSAKRQAVRMGRWFEGLPTVLAVTLTLGRDYHAVDWKRLSRNCHQWMKRNGWTGFMQAEVQQRGAMHKHGYLWHPAGMEVWPALQAYWLKVTKETGTLPERQTCEPVRSEDAAIAYMVSHATKKGQQDFVGRRWTVINPQAVEAASAPVGSWNRDTPPGLWPGWFRVASQALPFSPALWTAAAAGCVPRWFIGTPPDSWPVMTETPQGWTTSGWSLPPTDQTDPLFRNRQLAYEYQLDLADAGHGRTRRTRKGTAVQSSWTVTWDEAEGWTQVGTHRADGFIGTQAARNLARWSQSATGPQARARRMMKRAGLQPVETLQATEWTRTVTLPAAYQLPQVWTVPTEG